MTSRPLFEVVAAHHRRAAAVVVVQTEPPLSSPQLWRSTEAAATPEEPWRVSRECISGPRRGMDASRLASSLFGIDLIKSGYSAQGTHKTTSTSGYLDLSKATGQRPYVYVTLLSRDVLRTISIPSDVAQ